VGRWGGEEFLVICPQTDLDGAAALAEQLRLRVAGAEFPEVGHKTCSLGVATLARDESVATLLARADAALYRAKQAGRNRVEQGYPVQA
jgi:diguanylate cyclase (GGDEF)-like protein